MDDVLEILASAKEREYIGEPISQLEHALQAAYFAERAKAPPSLIIAALLHDIGHLLGKEQFDYPIELGVLDHEIVGANFLRAYGFKEQICELVGSHVEAKRYLVFKHATYRSKLSPASIETLGFQGGPMSENEAKKFERDPLFQAKIALRSFDERAKVVGLTVPKLATYVSLLDTHARGDNDVLREREPKRL